MGSRIFSSPLSRARRHWSRLGLDVQYAVASLPVLIITMLGLGTWVTQSIEKAVIHSTAEYASVFVYSFVTPELQDLASRPQLSDDATGNLSALLVDAPLGHRVLSIDVWDPAGRRVYHSPGGQGDRVLRPSAMLIEALRGNVAAQLALPGALEAAADHLPTGVPLLEVYMPVREHDTDRVIAVAEFYLDATEMRSDLALMRDRTWLVVVASLLAMYGLLFGIVRAGSRLIHSQAAQLGEKVAELSDLLAQNEALRARVGRASRRITEINEAFMRRLGAELHDGPAQALSLALLRLDHLAVRPAVASGVADDATVGRKVEEFERIRNTLEDAMREIRELCRGLSLPELAGLDMGAVVERAVASHQRRTHTAVEVDVDERTENEAVSMPVRLTAYRFIQEALMNAYRHAQGKGQAVSARRIGSWLELRVSDQGPGMPADLDEHASKRMGLSGLRERVEVLGGRFGIETAPGRGTTLFALLPLE